MRQATTSERTGTTGSTARRRAAVMLAVAVAAAAGRAGAATDNWTNPAGGSWGANANWSLAAPPTNNDDAVFNLSSTTPYTATLPAFEAANSLTVANGDNLTIDLAGQTLGLSVPYTGDPGMGQLNVTATAARPTSLTLAESNGTGGTVNVAASLSLGSDATLTVDSVSVVNSDVPAAGLTFAAGSTLTVRNGGSVSNGMHGGIALDGTATVDHGSATVGSGSAGNLAVGGSLALSNGSSAGGPNVFVGGGSASSAVAAVNVDRSTLACGGILSVGGGTYTTAFSFPITGPTTTTTVTADGSGSLAVTDGATASTLQAYVGAAGGTGTVTVAGMGSTFTNSLLFVGGTGSTGTLNASGGATVVTAVSATVGNGGFATAALSGVGTTWNVNGTVTVGSGGTLMIQSGATLSAVNLSLISATYVGLTGGTIRLAGGTLTDAALALPATATLTGTGTLTGTLANAGTVAPGGGTTLGILTVDGTYSQGSAAALDLVLDGTTPGTGYDRLAIDGSAAFGGTLDVTRAAGFDPTLGESFVVLTYGSEAGRFAAVDLPPLDPGLAWDTSRLYANGTIAVTSAVPEPATLGAVGLGAAGLLGRRCRAARRR